MRKRGGEGRGSASPNSVPSAWGEERSAAKGRKEAAWGHEGGRVGQAWCKFARLPRLHGRWGECWAGSGKERCMERARCGAGCMPGQRTFLACAWEQGKCKRILGGCTRLALVQPWGGDPPNGARGANAEVSDALRLGWEAMRGALAAPASCCGPGPASSACTP